MESLHTFTPSNGYSISLIWRRMTLSPAFTSSACPKAAAPRLPAIAFRHKTPFQACARLGSLSRIDS
jgi:hypothetical protein